MTVNNFIKSTLVLALLVASPGAFAQQSKSPEERAQSQTLWMQQNLALTKDQNQRVHDIMLHAAQQTDEAKASSNGGSMKNQMLNINTGRDIAIKNVLSPDQYPKYQEHMTQTAQSEGQGKK